MFTNTGSEHSSFTNFDLGNYGSIPASPDTGHPSTKWNPSISRIKNCDPFTVHRGSN